MFIAFGMESRLRSNQMYRRFVPPAPVTIFILLVVASSGAAKVSKSTAQPDLSDLVIGRDHVKWPSPESLVKNLRSQNEELRSEAFLLLGTPAQADTDVTDTSGISDQVQLRYAALGANNAEHAIVAVSVGNRLYGAVAAQTNGSWTRIANFSCWCKYESGDLLEQFIQVKDGPGRGSELVLRASGGGTGIYEQTEAHFRYYRGELRLVFSFVSRRRACDPTAPGPYTCQVERRWFYPQNFDSIPGGVLVETHLSFLPGSEAEAQGEIRELELRHSKNLSCKPYRWNQAKFVYELFSGPTPCKPTPREP
jgi:hypothetical protein